MVLQQKRIDILKPKPPVTHPHLEEFKPFSGFEFIEAKAPVNEAAKVMYLFGLTIFILTIYFCAFQHALRYTCLPAGRSFLLIPQALSAKKDAASIVNALFRV